MTLINKKYKPILATAVLIPTLSLAACGSADTNKNTTTQATTEAKTEATTQAVPETPVATETEATQASEYRSETLESFNQYKEFYTKTTMAYEDENGNVNIDRIDNVFKVINGEVADLTSSEVSSAVKNIEWMIYPEYVGKKINFKNTGGIDVIPEEELPIYVAKSAENPHFSQYLTNEDAKTAALKYESIMDKVIAEMNVLDEEDIPSNTVSEETIQELKQLIIDNENEYKFDIDHINDDTTSVGQKLVENIYYEKAIELYANITGELTFGEFYINENGEQAEAVSAYIVSPDTMTDRQKEVYNDYVNHYLGKDYKTAICEYERILSDYANDNANVHSKIDVKELDRESLIRFYQKQKELLLSMKNQYPEVSMSLHC